MCKGLYQPDLFLHLENKILFAIASLQHVIKLYCHTFDLRRKVAASVI